MIELEKVIKEINNFKLNVSLKIYNDEIYGIVGKSGAGKSTILNIIAGLDSKYSGKVVVPKKVAIIYQHFNLLNNKTVIENILLPLKLKKDKDYSHIDDILKFTNLKDKINLYPRSLSGGEKQRVAIARALASKPEILLADEPTASLDKETTDEIIKLFKELKKSILIITHDLYVAKKMCDKVAILEDGHIVDEIVVSKDYKNQDKKYSEYVKEVLNG